MDRVEVHLVVCAPTLKLAIEAAGYIEDQALDSTKMLAELASDPAVTPADYSVQPLMRRDSLL